MPHYHVHGLGHGLLDLEYHVTDGFLAEMSLVKGSMALVDEARQSELMARVGTLAAKRSCGGSAANTVIAVAQFGGAACHAFRVAADEIGRYYLADMQANGVDTGCVPVARGVTGRCLVFITPDGERTMCTYLGVSEGFCREDIQPQQVQAAQWLYIEGYLVTAPLTLEAANHAAGLAKKNNQLCALTFSDVNMIHYFRPAMESLLAHGMALIFCNEAEALAFTRQEEWEAAKGLLRQVAPTVCITRGGKGATILTPQGELNVSAPPTQAINTNGAGDLFAGAFLYGITHGFDLEKAGNLACLAASTLVTQPGARLEAAHTRSLLSRFAT